MSARCRFCGGKIASDAFECQHCGKVLRKRPNQESEEEKKGLTNLNSWSGKSIPPWLMYLVVAFFLFCLVVLFLYAGNDQEKVPKRDVNQSAPAE